MGWWLAVLSLGCGPSSDDAQPELCSGDAPIRLLELRDDQGFQLRPKLADRFILTVFEPVGRINDATHVEYWSVGPCGEDPVRLDLVGWPLGTDRALFDCGDAGIGLADPRGETPPEMIGPGLACFGTRPSGGLLAADPVEGLIGTMDLDGTFTPWLADARIAAEAGSNLARYRQELEGNVVALVDDDERLHFFDAESGASRGTIEGVDQVNLDPSGAFAILVAKDMHPVPGAPAFYDATLRSLKDESQVETVLGEGELYTYPIRDGWIVRRSLESPQAVRLSTMEVFEPPFADAFRGGIFAGGWIGFEANDPTSGLPTIWAWEPRSGQLTALASANDEIQSGRQGAFVFKHVSVDQSVDIDYVHYSSGERLVDHVQGASGPFLPLPDDGLLWFGEKRVDGTSTLHHRSLSGEPRIVDDFVVVSSVDVHIGWSTSDYDEGYDALTWSFADWGEPGDILYGVRDGSRTGIWRARLPVSD